MVGICNRSDASNEILYLNFNQDSSCISVGTRNGYRIYHVEPFEKCFHETNGGIGCVEMLFCTSLIALVGAGETPAFSPRRLRIWNTKTKTVICELNFITAVLAVQMNRDRVIVTLERKMYIFDLHTMSTLETLDIAPMSTQSLPLNVLSCDKKGYLAFPSGSKVGEILLYDTMNLNVVNAINAHTSAIKVMAFNQTGTLLATASEAGTLIRVFEIPTGKKKYSFRRGSYGVCIFGLAFNAQSTLLVASSETDTVHVFALSEKDTPRKERADSGETKMENGVSTQFRGLLNMPTTLMEGTRAFATARLRTVGVRTLCTIHGPEQGETVAKLLVR